MALTEAERKAAEVLDNQRLAAISKWGPHEALTAQLMHDVLTGPSVRARLKGVLKAQEGQKIWYEIPNDTGGRPTRVILRPTQYTVGMETFPTETFLNSPQDQVETRVRGEIAGVLGRRSARIQRRGARSAVAGAAGRRR